MRAQRPPTYNGGLPRLPAFTMPIYAYRCSACGHAKDVLQKISDPVLTTCPSCQAEAYTKQVTAAGFQLKGSGWYVTDFRGSGASKPADGGAGSTGPSAGASSTPESGSGGGSEGSGSSGSSGGAGSSGSSGSGGGSGDAGSSGSSAAAACSASCACH